MTKLYKFNKNAIILVALIFSSVHLYAQDLIINQNKVFELEQVQQSSKQVKVKVKEKEVEIIDLKEGQPDSIEDVLFKKEEIEKKPFVDPLYLAVSMKDYSKIGAILNSGVNVNQSFIEGNNIVLFSAQYKDITMLQLAVSKKANLNILNNNKESIVYLASTKNGKEYLENIKILLPSKDFEILINKQTKSGRNPLHNAIYNGDLETIKFLVNNKVNLETKDSNGQTPLHYAAALKKWDALEFMLKNGGNIKEIDKNNQTVESYIIERIDVFAMPKIYPYMNSTNRKIIEYRLTRMSNIFAEELKTEKIKEESKENITTSYNTILDKIKKKM